MLESGVRKGEVKSVYKDGDLSVASGDFYLYSLCQLLVLLSVVLLVLFSDLNNIPSIVCMHGRCE